MTPSTTPVVLSIDDIGAGMSLAEPVVSAQGEVVLAPGVELTQALLQALRRRGVVRLTVLVPDEGPGRTHDTASEMDVQAVRVALVQRLNLLFRHDDGRSGTARLRTLVTQHRLEAMP